MKLIHVRIACDGKDKVHLHRALSGTLMEWSRAGISAILVTETGKKFDLDRTLYAKGVMHRNPSKEVIAAIKAEDA